MTAHAGTALHRRRAETIGQYPFAKLRLLLTGRFPGASSSRLAPLVTRLDLLHELDHAVFAAYDWDSSMSDVVILDGLLALNLERKAAKAGNQAAEEEPEEDEELEESEE